ncbi:MAG: hypothetical protein Q8L34_04950 [Candidatus Woesearchaeota archaeon]|nr:hypothetical protein [Candidatus Woesearchaeota archaeon]
MDIAKKQELKRFINELKNIRGRHTELVSVYVPAGYDLNKIIGHLQEEQGTAKNIKDAKTRGNVIDSLERCVRHLRLFKKTPVHGLAIFAGNVAAQEGKVDIKIWSIEPPEPLNMRLYRCDQRFVIDVLEDMMEHKEVYGLILVDRREATLGLLKGSSITLLTDLTSGVPGKFKAGGQCLHPQTLLSVGEKLIAIKDVRVGDKPLSFNRTTGKIEHSVCLDTWKVTKDDMIEVFFLDSKLLASKDHTFFVHDKEGIKEKTADQLHKTDFLVDHQLNKVRIKSIDRKKGNFELIDIATQHRNFFANGVLVHNSAQRFERLIHGMAIEFFKRVSELCNKEFLPLKNLKGILLGGPGPTKEEFQQYLNNELKKKILAVQDLTYTDESGLHHLVEKSADILQKEGIIAEKKVMERFFTLLAKEPNKATYGEKEVRRVLELGAVELVLISEDYDDKKMQEIETLAQSTGTALQLISVDTQEGQQLRDLGGIAAILRFAVGNYE